MCGAHVSLVLLNRAEHAATGLLVRHATKCVESFPRANQDLLEDQGTVPGVLLGDLVEVPEGLGQGVEQLLPIVAFVTR